jgi:hypothetical protein
MDGAWAGVVEGIGVVGRLWVMGRDPRQGCLNINYARVKLEDGHPQNASRSVLPAVWK